MGFFKKIKEGLKKTRDAVVGQIDSMLKSFTKIDDELFEELEELLVMGDVGVPTAEKICKRTQRKGKKGRYKRSVRNYFASQRNYCRYAQGR